MSGSEMGKKALTVAEVGRLGGLARTKAKAIAARRNAIKARKALREKRLTNGQDSH